jgi:hypothetical protein
VNRIAVALISLPLITPAEAASASAEDAIVKCLIGNAATSLHKQLGGKKVTASVATDVAMAYASKRCKGGTISEGAGDYVYHSIKSMASQWFGD